MATTPGTCPDSTACFSTASMAAVPLIFRSPCNEASLAWRRGASKPAGLACNALETRRDGAHSLLDVLLKAVRMTLTCDLIVRDATIFDGTGAPRRRGDVGVNGDRIVAVGDLGAARGTREVMAEGRALSPGFIDAHTHDDRAVLCGPECMLCKMSQGVTTVVVGNCGISLSPSRMDKRPPPPLDLLGDESWWTFDSFAAYAERLARDPSPVNTYALIGHMSLRVEAMAGDVARAATDAEAQRMQRRLAEALAEGASGFSTGLWYPPNMHAPTEEVVAVAEALRAAGGMYVTHMRDEAAGVLTSIEETLRIGREAGVPVVISHHKCAMPENYGRSAETL